MKYTINAETFGIVFGQKYLKNRFLRIVNFLDISLLFFKH